MRKKYIGAFAVLFYYMVTLAAICFAQPSSGTGVTYPPSSIQSNTQVIVGPANGAQTFQALSDNSTGTALNKTVCGASQGLNTVVTCGAGAAGPILGICTANCGVSTYATITYAGANISAVFDGATTAGHVAVPSATTAGDLHDSGLTIPGNTLQAMGLIKTTNGAGGTFGIDLSRNVPGEMGGVTTCDYATLSANAFHLFFWSNGSGQLLFCNNQVTPTIQGGYNWANTQSFTLQGAALNLGTAGSHIVQSNGGLNVTLGACGTSPTIGSFSGDTVGVITAGTGTTTCAVVFNTAYTTGRPPICQATEETRAAALFVSARSNTGFTVSGLTAGDTFDYQCMGMN